MRKTTKSESKGIACPAHYFRGQPIRRKSPKFTSGLSRGLLKCPRPRPFQPRGQTPRRLTAPEDDRHGYFLRQGLSGRRYCRCHLQNSRSSHRESQASPPGERVGVCTFTASWSCVNSSFLLVFFFCILITRNWA